MMRKVFLCQLFKILPYTPQPPEQYTVPSIWNDETSEEVAGWFALKNLREIKINPGDFTATSGQDLLDSLDSRAYMIYCERTKK